LRERKRVSVSAVGERKMVSVQCDHLPEMVRKSTPLEKRSWKKRSSNASSFRDVLEKEGEDKRTTKG